MPSSFGWYYLNALRTKNREEKINRVQVETNANSFPACMPLFDPGCPGNPCFRVTTNSYPGCALHRCATGHRCMSARGGIFSSILVVRVTTYFVLRPGTLTSVMEALTLLGFGQQVQTGIVWAGEDVWPLTGGGSVLPHYSFALSLFYLISVAKYVSPFAILQPLGTECSSASPPAMALLNS